MRVRSEAPLMALTAFILSAAAPVAMAINAVVVETDRFAYSGSVTVTGGSAVSMTGDLDLGLVIGQNDPRGFDDINQILTAWYYSNSPSSPEGLVQLYDYDGNTDTELSGFWSADLKTFSLRLKGKDANADPWDSSPSGDEARLWNGVDSGTNDAGLFKSYSLELTAQFANAAADGNNDGFYDIAEDPTGVNGSFTGLFENENDGKDYSFAFNLNMNSTVINDPDRLDFYPSYFGSNTVVPEPGTLVLLGLGFMGLAATRRRKIIG